jgi:hypothetical protein
VIVLSLVPVVLSLLLLGAHFLRAGAVALLPLVAITLVLPAVKRPWAARTVQAGLLLGGVEWVRTLLRLAAVRSVLGEPATKMVAILGAVTLFTLLSALVFELGPMKRRYGLRKPQG